LVNQFKEFIEGDKTPRADAIEEAKNFRVVLAAYLSSATGKMVDLGDLRSN
jgi:hypothetical protein